MARSQWFNDQVAERLEEAMRRRGWNDKMLADQVGVSESTVYKWRMGHQLPKGRNLTALCQALGISEEGLLAVASREVEDREVAARFVAVLNRVMAAGQSVAEALDTEFDDPELLSGQERQRAMAATPVLRRLVSRLAKRAWDRLTPAEKEEVALQLMEMESEGASSDA